MIFNRLRNHKVILKNTGYLTIIEIVRLLMPFVALPYIIQTIGTENYGTVVFAQTIVSYFIILINFGLEISAVRDVASARNDREKLNSIVSSVFFVKLILFTLSLTMLLTGLFSIEFMINHRLLFLFSFLTCISELLFPIWFFQGIQKMKYITFIRTTSILFYTIGIFLFIKGSSDYIYVALLQSLSSILSGLLAMYVLIYIEKIRFVFPGMSMIKATFKDSTPFFASRLSVVFNAGMAKTVSGIFFSMDMVAAFELAQKFASMALIPMQMLNQSVYPHIATTLDKRFTNRFFLVNIGISMLAGIAIFIFAPLAVYFFAKDSLPEAVILSRILTLYVVFAGMNSFLGSSVLVSFGHKKIFNSSVIFSSILLLFIYFIYDLAGIFSIENFALALVSAEFMIFIVRLGGCLRYGIINKSFFTFKSLPGKIKKDNYESE